MADELLFRSALDLAEMIRHKEVSPVELTELALERIERHNPALNAFVTVDAEGALAAAKAAEACAGDEGNGPFHGVPIGIKDLHLAAGMRATFGSKALADLVSPVDEVNVARLRAAGFVFLGKTNVPEFGTVAYSESDLLGPARNPWSTDHTPGGSSGGAAASVAAGLAPVAHGSDGGGSIRIPASNCGLFGMKPARGRVTLAPLFGDQLAGLTTTGPITRYVEDAAAMLDVMAGYCPGDPYWAPPPERPFLDDAREDPASLRVGIVTDVPLFETGPEALRVVEETGRLLESLGHHVEPFRVPIVEKAIDDFFALWAAGMEALPVETSTLEPFNRWLAEEAAARTSGQLLQAIAGLQQATREIVGAMLAFDVVIASTLTRPPLRVGEFADLAPKAEYQANFEYVGLTPVANFTGLPACNLPLGFSEDGLPMGTNVFGRPADESMLFRLAGQVQRATSWPQRRAPGMV